MNATKAGDIMVPLKDYPLVDSSATVLDAVVRLDESRRTMEPGRQPYQAVLVSDSSGAIVGKLGQLSLLRALEPRSHVADDHDTLERAGVSDAVMETALGHLRTLQWELSEMCQGAASLPVRTVMHPVKEHIDIAAPLCEVIHQMVAWQTLSVLVTEDGRPVGLVRLSDVCDEVINQMRQTAPGRDDEV